jgi:hypothetical protein
MKRFLKVFSALHTATYRVTGGRVWDRMYGVPILLLTTHGRKSGKLRTKPLMYGRDGDGFVLVGSRRTARSTHFRCTNCSRTCCRSPHSRFARVLGKWSGLDRRFKVYVVRLA